MASDALTSQAAGQLVDRRAAAHAARQPTWKTLLMPLASLRITVALFAMAIFLIFAGTLAQVDQDIWDVMRQYFRTFFARIEFQVFFPKSFFVGAAPQVPGYFYFPGGWLIGGAMGINLLAAHGLRFKVQVRGPRLLAGLAVIAIGVVLTWAVVAGGSGKDTIEGAAPMAWATLWNAMKICLASLWMAAVYSLVKLERDRTIERWGMAAFCLLLGGLVGWIIVTPDATLGDSSMRILWQLVKGGLAGLVLLAGCILLFKKRAGIVLLHAGVALVMANELVVYGLHVEGQMQIMEGETVNYVYDIRDTELAVIDPSDAKTDNVVVVPRGMLKTQERIHDDRLPVDVEVVDYLQNSSLVDVKPGEKNLATAGAGLETIAEPKRAGSGTDAGGKVDMTSAYVKLFAPGADKALGTYLLSVAFQNPQKVQIDGKTYDIALRFKRTYKPYSMRLEDVRADTYLGTQTAKNYSSDLRLVDAAKNVDQDVKIWMNNPLRFAGETFYQSSYFVDRGREGTILQVVTNAGWMIPYVACVVVGIGMLAQFSTTLLRFLNRLELAPVAAPLSRRAAKRGAQAPRAGLVARYLPAAVVLVFAAWVAAAAMPKHVPLDQMKLDEFGRLPVVHEGRVKPLDTVARNTLRYFSGKQTYTDDSGAKRRTVPATEWLLDVIARPEVAVKAKMFRIDNMELLATLGLEKRSGYRYSISEFAKHIGEAHRQAELASKLEPGQATVYQKKLIELIKKLDQYRLLGASFEPPELRPDHAEEDLAAAIRDLDVLSRTTAPLAVPPASKDGRWETFAEAWFDGVKARARGQQPNPATVAMTALVVDYGKQDVTGFNSNLAAYQKWLSEQQIPDLSERKLDWEGFFNSFEPFYCAVVLYPIAGVLVVISWLLAGYGDGRWLAPFGRAAFWLLVFTFLVHTFAIGLRIYISGRPPVTNLYSSAVFIGWAGVLFGLILEMIFHKGIGSICAAVIGFATLLIANFLAGMTDGDTLGVLQAVLDTQFWLATHVVCITLGYATTFVAGFFGVVYILASLFAKNFIRDFGKDLSRMTYGVVCFAMFFSFVGTVLGGLWADDSWGRFWGWDPKENGALMIVLWNALVLHASWGGMVRERGLAVLAIGGNIVTSWSYFGVNELGVGLHSYGFTEGVLMALGLFVASQLAIIALGLFLRGKRGDAAPLNAT